MRIGINASGLLATGASLAQLRAHHQEAEQQGFDSYWLGQLAIPDALTTAATIGQGTAGIEIGTAVVPTWGRHPLLLAAQALTVQEAIGNRLVLGIGVGHKDLIEPALKVEFRRLAQHMQEYLAVLGPALHERQTSFSGEIWSGHGDLSVGLQAAQPPPVMIAAMGPRMLRIAGTRADGVILWLAGPRTIAETIKPRLETVASEAGRPEPRIIAGLPVCVTGDALRVRATIERALGPFTRFDSYRDVLAREGASGPSDVALVGTAEEVRNGVDALAASGATDFAATEFVTNADEARATRELLAELASEARAPVL